MWWYTGILLATFAVSYLGCFAVRWITQKKGWVAQPSSDRWHQVPTSLHGGVAIFSAFLLGVIAWLYLSKNGTEYRNFDLHRIKFHSHLVILLSGISIIFVVGLIDDIFRIKPGMKLLGQLIAVSLVIFMGFGFDLTPYPWVNILFSYLWFVGIINAVNLLDNMDGVSSGVVAIGTLGVCLIGLFEEGGAVPLSVFIGGILIVSILGFWFHNKPPAKLFMGDSGSLVLGFVFAALTIPSELNDFLTSGFAGSIWGKVLQLLIAVTLAAIPILDTTLVTITRMMRGQSPSVGGKDHSTHRLAHSGLTAWQTLAVLYSVSGVCAVIAFFMDLYPDFAFLVFGVAFLSITIVAVYLASVRIQVAPIKKEGWQQLVTSFAYRIPLIKMVLDVVLVGLSFHFAYLIRFDFQLSAYLRVAMLNALPIVVICCLISNFLFKVYEFSWRSASSRDILNYGFASVLGTVMSIALVTLLFSFGLGNSRGAYVIFCLVYFLALAGSRFSFRFIDDLLMRFRLHQTPEGKIPLLLYGSNRYAKATLDEIQHDDGNWFKYRVIGIVDSTDGSSGKLIQGIPVKPDVEWIDFKFVSLPEILVVDDSVENTLVKQFASKIGSDIRLRRLTRKIQDIS
jgi:UDP-GlcNAc:undecaprenyl-phosphate/decaprenyl-phosphate GlcNAc-1-phosphate transferase